jgi:hypothetical protein
MPHPTSKSAPQRSRSRHSVDFQIALPGLSQVDEAVAQLAGGGIEARGAIFTRREVVDFILDLVGYKECEPLLEARLLEPSFGNGDFLFPALDRLFAAYIAAGSPTPAMPKLRDAIRAIELHRETYEQTFATLLRYLAERGLSQTEQRTLAHAWLRQGDFLLEEMPSSFTHIVGNPPYVRQELIPDILMAEYRRRYATIYDRADLYIPFIERALQLLVPGGGLGLICADRWMKNRYGGPLRRLIAENYHLRAYVDMVDTPAFHSDVIAYPAIFILGNDRPGLTRFAHRPEIEATSLTLLAEALGGSRAHPAVREIAGVAHGDEPWILDSPDQLAIVRRLERAFPTLEEAGCKVGIGVATGADHVFIALFDELDVEPSRKLPIVMARDIQTGTVHWGGKGVLNPFNDDCSLVSLKKYPKFAHYIDEHGKDIRKRHVSQKNPDKWYRTIDRIYPSLTHVPKLLIPDIKGEANVVFDEGRYYPHHNLYFVTSDSWDLHALQVVLKSDVTKLFLTTYSTKMRGGYLRFQAQYLRRIRLPNWAAVPEEIRARLLAASHANDRDASNRAVFDLYGFTADERRTLGGSGD